jgi:quercetin dioxygenase-like cupin family protein
MIRLLRSLTLLACLLAVAQSPSKPLSSSVFEWERLAVKRTANGERRDIVDSPTATFVNLESHVTTLDEGKASHAPHRHDDEEIVIVKDGTLVVTIEGKSQRAGAGSMLFFASGELHGLRNAGSGRAAYYVIRAVTRRK